jgi:hypothetical protein
VISVLVDFNHCLLLLLLLCCVALAIWTWIALRWLPMTALAAGLAVQCAPCTRSAFANVQCKFVAEFCRVEAPAAVQRFAAIAGAALSRDMIALLLPELANCANVRAVASASSSD